MSISKGLVGCVLEAVELISATPDSEVGIFYDKMDDSYQVVVDAKMQFIKRVEQFERFRMIMHLDYKVVEALMSVDWLQGDRFEAWTENLRG